jgi:hypothetical protein
MAADPSYAARLKLWASYALAVAGLSLLSALLNRFVGSPVTVQPPPLPPITVVVTPGEPGAAATVRVFPGAP